MVKQTRFRGKLIELNGPCSIIFDVVFASFLRILVGVLDLGLERFAAPAPIFWFSEAGQKSIGFMSDVLNTFGYLWSFLHLLWCSEFKASCFSEGIVS